MVKSQPLVFFGNERLATGLSSTDAPVLRALIAEGYPIAAVVSNFTAGRSRSARPLEIAEIARAYNIPVLIPHKVTELIPFITKVRPIAGVLVAYGRIIPAKIINMFPKGIINIHPSLLPKYRGPTPIEQAILDGATITGVSIMQLTDRMDAGPVYAQAQYRLVRQETKEELAERLLQLGKNMIVDILPSILDGSAEAWPQNDNKATYCSLINKHDGIVNPSIQTAKEIERTVRAYAGYPKTQLHLGGHKLIITKASLTAAKEPGQLAIDCHDNTLLAIDELVAPSGRHMSGADFIRGYMK